MEIRKFPTFFSPPPPFNVISVAGVRREARASGGDIEGPDSLSLSLSLSRVAPAASKVKVVHERQRDLRV
jgi:hypothetical protein